MSERGDNEIDRFMEAIEQQQGSPQHNDGERNIMGWHTPDPETILPQPWQEAEEGQAMSEQIPDPKLTREEAETAKLALQDTWIMQPDDEPLPNSATRAWRKLRRALSEEGKR